jgi:hypothetical protein
MVVVACMTDIYIYWNKKFFFFWDKVSKIEIPCISLLSAVITGMCQQAQLWEKIKYVNYISIKLFKKCPNISGPRWSSVHQHAFLRCLATNLFFQGHLLIISPMHSFSKHVWHLLHIERNVRIWRCGGREPLSSGRWQFGLPFWAVTDKCQSVPGGSLT